MTGNSRALIRLVAFALAASVVVAVLSAQFANRVVDDVLREQAVNAARLLAARLERAVLRDSTAEAKRVVATAAGLARVEAVRVIGADGRELARWGRSGTSWLLRDRAEEDGAAPDSDVILVDEPILAARRPIGLLTLEVSSHSAASRHGEAVLFGAVAFLGLLLAGALGLAGAAPRPTRARPGRAASGAAPPAAPGTAPLGLNDLRAEVERQAEELGEAREALDALTEAKSRFLANISHEIRTPLNGVLGMTELLLNTSLDTKQRSFIQTLRRSAEALLNIVNDVLDFSRMESGKLCLEELDFDLGEVVEDVTQLHAESAQGKGLELVCHIPPGCPSAVRGDPARLRQVLTNLLSNAVKFTERGEVLLQVRTVSESPDAVMYEIDVADTGIGIPGKLQERIFASFVQADASSTRRYGGSGLGLAISRHLVELMGGSISVESKPGQGARFKVLLPLGRGQIESPAATHAEDSTIQGLRVLAVDDNETNRTILAEQLASWQVEGDERADGSSALAALRAAAAAGRPYQVAIVDMLMPEMDGVQLARAIKADPAIRDVRIMLLTSATLDLSVDEMREIGIEQFTTKPARQSQLYNCLVTLVGRTPRPRRGARGEVPEAHARRPLATRAKVLLAEDNAVNQEVARSMLDALGCDVEVVENGRAAVLACASQTFDVILMDCQMPVMDGFEATVALKESVAGDGAPFGTPIVALTANALAGDRERCLAAGMDDYVSKPFKQIELRAVLERWIVRPHAPPAPRHEQGEEPRAAGEGHAPVRLDPAALEALRRLQRPGRPDVLAKVVALYVDRSPALVDAMRAAYESRDFAGLQAAAHSLKSSSANLGATEAAALCKTLEQMGRSCSAEGFPETFARLEAAFGATLTELERILENPSPASAADAEPLRATL